MKLPLNNWKHKRAFSNGLWMTRSTMFPWPNRKYVMIGLFGFIFKFEYGNYNMNTNEQI
jgi:hypothetical protein